MSEIESKAKNAEEKNRIIAEAKNAELEKSKAETERKYLQIAAQYGNYEIKEKANEELGKKIGKVRRRPTKEEWAKMTTAQKREWLKNNAK